jgi:hypothetical protein
MQRDRRELTAAGGFERRQIDRRIFEDERLNLGSQHPPSGKLDEHLVNRARPAFMQPFHGALKPNVS